jgi:nucleotide-binding universal stress UspA family protein
MNGRTADSGQILVAVDGSPASLEALRHGQRMAMLTGSEVVAVAAWRPFRHLVLPPTSGHPRDAAQELVEKSIVEAFRGMPTPNIRVVTVEGDPATALVELSAQADLLVVGSRGHSGMAGVLLGSVSAACAAQAACPVLVVHAPTITDTSSTAREGASVAAEDRIIVTF